MEKIVSEILFLKNIGVEDFFVIDDTFTSQAAGAKGGLARRALVEAAAALRAKSMPAGTVRDPLSASIRPAARLPTTPPSQRFSDSRSSRRA